MSIVPHQQQGPQNPEEALALVDPERREFAVVWAEGKTAVADLCKLAGISSATYYRWVKDEAILTYADAVGRTVGRQAKRRLRGETEGAIQTIVDLMNDYDAPHAVRLKAATEILDRAGVTKEEITRAGAGGGDTVVQVNLSIPINADARAEQEERRRRREAAQEATYVDVTDE